MCRRALRWLNRPWFGYSGCMLTIILIVLLVLVLLGGVGYRGSSLETMSPLNLALEGKGYVFRPQFCQGKWG